MTLRPIALALTLLAAPPALAQEPCAFTTDMPITMLTAAFEAWKAMTDTMAECAPNFQAELDQQFRDKQPTAFAAEPSLYHIGGVSNGTITPLLQQGVIRPLDDLVEQYGQGLNENQIVRVDGQIMAIAMMVNMHHLQYRQDIFDELGLEPPTTYDELLAAAEAIQAAGVVDYPLGATMKSGWDLGLDFVNLYSGLGGDLFEGSEPAIDNATGIETLEKLKALTEYMDPEWTVSDSTYVQQQLQQGEIAMANFWQSRAGAADDEAESQVVGQVATAASPYGKEGGRPSTMIWWDGFVIASNITDEEAEAAFRLALEGVSPRTVEKAPAAAVWLIDGYEPGRLAEGAIATLQLGALPYPSTAEMGLMQTALGNNVADFLLGSKSAEQTLADAEASYRLAAQEAGLL